MNKPFIEKLNLKKTTLVMGLLLQMTHSFTQCTYKKNFYDEFTNHKIVQTEDVWLTMGLATNATMSFMQVDSFYYIKFNFSDLSIWSVSDGDQLMFKMGDSTLVKLTTNDRVTADYSIASGVTIWSGTVNYPLTKEDLSTFVNIDAIKVRFYTTDGYIEKEIKSKRFDSIKKVAGCLYNIK